MGAPAEAARVLDPGGATEVDAVPQAFLGALAPWARFVYSEDALSALLEGSGAGRKPGHPGVYSQRGTSNAGSHGAR